MSLDESEVNYTNVRVAKTMSAGNKKWTKHKNVLNILFWMSLGHFSMFDTGPMQGLENVVTYFTHFSWLSISVVVMLSLQKSQIVIATLESSS
jgi:hypothetical protein